MDMLSGEKLVITLKMNDTTLPDTVSRNVIGEIRGREKPEEVVVVSGHIDSWDVGQGAMDDGGGMIISQEALALLRFLELRPRRTLRSILWTTEEFGLIGVQQYIKQHAEDMNNFVTVFESDIGTFRPVGLDFSGTDDAGCILQEVLKLLSPVNATEYRKLPEVGSDIGYFIEKGVPGVSLNTERSKYFWYHHSEGDTMTVENSDELDLCTAVWTVASYVIADLSVTLPRG
jgi:carboxypeptidase Q